MKKCLSIFLLAFVQYCGFGQQWHKLADPVNPPVPQFTQWQIFPTVMVPVANGKIMYGHFYHTGGGMGPETVNLYLATDNLAGSAVYCGGVSSNDIVSGSVSLGRVTVFNDSTLSYVTTFQGFPAHVGRWNNFTYHKWLQYPGNSSRIGAIFNTNNYIYAFVNLPPVLPYSDTVTFVRTAKTSTITSYIKLSNYIIDQYGIDHNFQFLNDSLGYAFIRYRSNYSKTVVIKTEDRGSTWTELMIDSVNQINRLYFPSANVGYIKKSGNILYKTVDGGLNWSLLPSPTTSSINCLRFCNDTLGYIGCNGGELWKTANGGSTWTNETTNCSNNIVNLYTYGNVAYFVTDAKTVHKNGPDVDVVNVGENSLEIGGLSLFPNPADDILMIDLPASSEQMSVEIYDLFGKVLMTKKGNLKSATRIKLDVSGLTSGIYVVRIKLNGEVATKKIHVTH